MIKRVYLNDRCEVVQTIGRLTIDLKKYSFIILALVITACKKQNITTSDEQINQNFNLKTYNTRLHHCPTDTTTNQTHFNPYKGATNQPIIMSELSRKERKELGL